MQVIRWFIHVDCGTIRVIRGCIHEIYRYMQQIYGYSKVIRW